MNKKERFSNLVNEFKLHKFSDDKLHNPYSINGVVNNDEEFLSPWNLWHGNLNAEILFIGQDFSTDKYYENMWENERKSPTNKSLAILFSVLGYNIGLPEPNKRNQLPLFFTNAVLGLKEGKMNGKIKESWYKETRHYLKSTIEIIKPKVIISMGKIAYEAINDAYEKKMDVPYKEAIETGEGLSDGAMFFAVGHCSGLGKRNRNFDTQKSDWERIKGIIEL